MRRLAESPRRTLLRLSFLPALCLAAACQSANPASNLAQSEPDTGLADAAADAAGPLPEAFAA